MAHDQLENPKTHSRPLEQEKAEYRRAEVGLKERPQQSCEVSKGIFI
jgi:hypothetical protein